MCAGLCSSKEQRRSDGVVLTKLDGKLVYFPGWSYTGGYFKTGPTPKVSREDEMSPTAPYSSTKVIDTVSGQIAAFCGEYVFSGSTSAIYR